MTQEQELLLKDLCARLMYGVKCQGNVLYDMTTQSHIKATMTLESVNFGYDFVTFKELPKCPKPYDSFIPYLRPISSMTEEERKSLITLIKLPFPFDLVDWLNKKMFDYRGLIKKGLALEAPEGMY